MILISCITITRLISQFGVRQGRTRSIWSWKIFSFVQFPSGHEWSQFEEVFVAEYKSFGVSRIEGILPGLDDVSRCHSDNIRITRWRRKAENVPGQSSKLWQSFTLTTPVFQHINVYVRTSHCYCAIVQNFIFKSCLRFFGGRRALNEQLKILSYFRKIINKYAQLSQKKVTR